MYGGPQENRQHSYLYGTVSWKARLFGNMDNDKECDYDLTWIDDFSARGGDKGNCSVGENKFKHVQGCYREGIVAITC